MFRKSLIATLVAAATHTALAAPLLSQIRIVVENRSSVRPTASLYKVGPASAAGTWIANVDTDGVVRPSYRCASSDRITIDVRRPGLQLQDEPQPCADRLEFHFFIPLLADSQPFQDAEAARLSGDYAKAHAQFSAIAAAARANKDGGATVASDAAVKAAATYLGDVKLDKLVTRDPAQNNAVVLTTEGERTLMQFQRGAKIQPTGKLDFPTQKAMLGRPGVRAAIK